MIIRLGVERMGSKNQLLPKLPLPSIYGTLNEAVKRPIRSVDLQYTTDIPL